MLNSSDFAQMTAGPVFAILVGLVLLTFVVTFVLPLILKASKVRFNVVYLSKKVGGHLTLVIALVSILVIVVAGGYYFYMTSRPTVVSAEKFKEVEETSLSDLKSTTSFEAYKNSDLLLIDVRSGLDFYNGHIAKSFNLPASAAESRNLTPLEGRRVAVFSWRDRYDEAYSAAKTIKNRDVAEKVYVVQEGFEGLKEAGFEVKVGSAFEEY
jgi:rhodanese-related sulfurtransferase